MLYKVNTMIKDKIDDYGGKLGIALTSEDVLGITKPPEYQCSYIDSVIMGVKDSQETIQDADYYIRWEEFNKVEKYVNNLEANFKGMSEELEDVRQSIIELRQWGDEWKMIAKWLVEKTDITVEEIIEYVKENKEE